VGELVCVCGMYGHTKCGMYGGLGGGVEHSHLAMRTCVRERERVCERQRVYVCKCMCDVCICMHLCM